MLVMVAAPMGRVARVRQVHEQSDTNLDLSWRLYQDTLTPGNNFFTDARTPSGDVSQP